MGKRVYIKELADHVGEEVTLFGWLYNKRSSGKLAFLIVRDGTGLVQAVVSADEVTTEVWAELDQLEYEASLRVTGRVRADERAPGGHELSLMDLAVIGGSSDYPIQLKDHGIDFLLEHRHLWLRSPKQVAIMRVRDEVIKAIRDFFYDRGFVNVDSPILTGAVGESAGTLFSTEYFDMGTAYLAQTGQLYVEAAAAALGKVYCFGPTFRAEKSKTRRHLTEFWMLEPEMAWCDSQCNMKVQEELVVYLVERAMERCRDVLEGPLERELSALEAVVPPFPRLSYDEAVEKLKGRGSSIEWGSDLGAEDETTVVKDYDQPVFIYNYPKGAKAFYMKENPDDLRTVLCNDLIAPEGYGEIIGGSQREDDHDRLQARIREEGLPEEAYGWYLDLRRYGTFPHSGFGLGLERTVAWICGVHHIRETIAFPRTLNRLYP